MCNLYSNFATKASMAKGFAANRDRSGSAEAGPLLMNESPAIAGAWNRINGTPLFSDHRGPRRRQPA